MKFFKHAQFPFGSIVTGAQILDLIASGQAKVLNVTVNGANLDSPEDHLKAELSPAANSASDRDLFILCNEGFVWWKSHIGVQAKMADLELCIYLYTDEDDVAWDDSMPGGFMAHNLRLATEKVGRGDDVIIIGANSGMREINPSKL